MEPSVCLSQGCPLKKLSMMCFGGFLAEFLKMIGIDEDAVNIDAEGLEHHLHSETLRKLQESICLVKDHSLIGLH
jgi:hypothetical protein